jgi:S1-C subfamily serine protease
MLCARFFRHGTATALLTLVAVAPRPVRADPKVYAKVLPGTAWVITADGHGSGVLVDRSRRLMLTNYHVVQQNEKVAVFFPEVRQGKVVSEPGHYIANAQRLALAAEVVFTDPQRDLAIVRLPSVPVGARVVPLAAASPKPGQTIHALGNSGVGMDMFGQVRGVLWRYSKGAVRQVYRQQLGFTFHGRVVENQLPLNPGDSGGPIVNDRGELVGLVMAGDLSRRLVSFGVDISEIRKCLADFDGTAEDADEESLSDPP